MLSEVKTTSPPSPSSGGPICPEVGLDSECWGISASKNRCGYLEHLEVEVRTSWQFEGERRRRLALLFLWSC